MSSSSPLSFDSSLLLPPPSLWLVIAAAAAVAAAVLLLLHHHHVSWSRRKGHPPGSVGPLPLVGETLRLIHAYKTDPEPFVDDRVLRHGRIFTTHIFGERTVFSADPEFNRLILSGEGRSFFASYPASISNLLGAHSVLITPVGSDNRHKRMHTLILSHLASPAALRDSPFHLLDIDRLVRYNLRTCFRDERSPFRLLDQAKKITFELTINQLMSVEPGEWTQTLHRHYVNLIEGFFALPLSLPSFFPFSSYAGAIRARRKVEASLTTVIKERREQNNQRRRRSSSTTTTAPKEDDDKEEKKKKRDILDELLSAEEQGFYSSEDEIIDFILSLLVAGYETTSTIITISVKFLTDNPAALAAVRAEHEEIRARKGEEEPLNWNDYKSMTFTQCVINETLRIVNVVGGVFRRAATDVHFKGYTIPKGTKVIASLRAVHLDPDYYKNARTFNPWRWQEKDAPSLTGGAGGTYTPFGGGPRLCPGYELARVEISVFLHYLTTHFSWEAAEEDRLVFFPTTRTLKGYPINVRRRKSI